MNNEEWNAHNGLLQQAYRAYLHAVKQKEKDEAIMLYREVLNILENPNSSSDVDV